MSAGKLDQRVTVQELIRVNNEGSLSESYSDVATVWADVTGARGSEALQSAQVQARRIVRVKIRYRADVTTSHRIVWQDENYNITEVDRTSRRDGYLYLNCEIQSGD